MLRAFMRLNKSVQHMIIVLMVMLGALLIWVLSKLMASPIIDNSGWPQSSLEKVFYGQGVKFEEYEDLPTRIQFPGTKHSIMIGGANAYAYNEGSSFRYGDAAIVASISDDGDIVSEMTDNYSLYLTGVRGQGNFKSYIHDSGYFNSFQAWYQGGILTLNGQQYYVVAHRFLMDDGKFIQIGVVSVDAKYLTSMKDLLDRICYTYGVITDTDSQINDAGASKTSDGIVGNTKNSVVITDNSEGQTSDGTRTRDEIAGIDAPYDAMSTPEMIDNFKTNDAEAQYNLAYPDRPEYLEETCEVSDELSQKGAVFCFAFSHSDTVPKECILISPSGKHYSPDDNNNTRTGYIVFYIDKPEKGKWGIKLSTNNQYGTYDFSCTDKDSFISENRGYPPNAEIWDSQNSNF